MKKINFFILLCNYSFPFYFYLLLKSKIIIKFRYSADFHPLTGCVETCCAGDRPRTYLHVLENGIEYNDPFTWNPILPGCFPKLKPGCCILQSCDNIWKIYFDRAFWDQRDLCWRFGCLQGDAFPHPNNG